ncbi:DNA polymerase III, delta prime subunit [Arboricoccus pini]|uniref:DNA polymerase III, delta prime subunit n=1 Tax=Arboricoccus pini TaxID=1963835 RepID=A0A212PX38_9PROT|nr:DNA polymerase III subunit delta' [Arboricoccus pini]SNB51483.1 DNA polymerase III, delta prime subunit [Arboricoccus pini]
MSESPLIEPRLNPHLFGHAAALAAIQDLDARRRLAHGWMLTGAPGIGKATAAYHIARLLLAIGGGDVQDPAHPVFRMVAANAHPDLKVITRETAKSGRLRTEIVVDQIREVGASFRTTAAIARHRVLLIDAADELNTEAANALLKLLEEPPPDVVILLVVQRPGRLPRTLASRCAIMRLKPLDAPAMAEALATLLPGLNDEDLARLSLLAEGSPGRVLRLHATGWLADYQALLQIFGASSDSDRLFAFAEILQRRVQAHGLEQGLDPLTTLLRRAATLHATPDMPLLSPEEAPALSTLAARGLDPLLASWDSLRIQALRIEALNLDALQSFLLLADALLPPGRPLPQAG